MGILRRISWRPVLLAAIVAEIALVPLTAGASWVGYALALPDLVAMAGFNLAMLIALVPAGYWAARKAGAEFALNGIAVGIVAALIFLPPLLLGLAGGPIHETINELLKVAGGGAGGLLARRRRQAPTPPGIA